MRGRIIYVAVWLYAGSGQMIVKWRVGLIVYSFARANWKNIASGLSHS